MIKKHLIKKRFSPKQVEAYEKLSGFKTTGKVTQTAYNNAIWKLYEDIMTPLIGRGIK